MLTRISRPRTGQEGFTLIELLVVVAIIALLATFAVPRLFEAINKAKEAPGKADLQTISAALDRHYFDKNAYPGNLDALVTEGYLKTTVTFRNGYKNGYAYARASDAATNGDAYLLIDPQAIGAADTTACGLTWTPSAGAKKDGALTKAAIDGCTAPAGMSLIKY